MNMKLSTKLYSTNLSKICVLCIVFITRRRLIWLWLTEHHTFKREGQVTSRILLMRKDWMISIFISVTLTRRIWQPTARLLLIQDSPHEFGELTRGDLDLDLDFDLDLDLDGDLPLSRIVLLRRILSPQAD